MSARLMAAIPARASKGVQYATALCLALGVMLVMALPSFAQTNPAAQLGAEASSGVSSAQGVIIPIIGAMLLFAVVVGYVLSYVKRGK